MGLIVVVEIEVYNEKTCHLKTKPNTVTPNRREQHLQSCICVTRITCEHFLGIFLAYQLFEFQKMYKIMHFKKKSNMKKQF